MKIQIKVKPNSKEEEILKLKDASLLVQPKSSPVRGKTNSRLINILVKKYQIAQFQMTIKHGLTSKQKLVEIL